MMMGAGGLAPALTGRHPPALLYRSEKLMEHLKLFGNRLNIPRLIRVCDEQQHWKELSLLYVAYDEYDNAAICMINHSSVAWEHVQFKDVAVKVRVANRRTCSLSSKASNAWDALWVLSLWYLLIAQGGPTPRSNNHLTGACNPGWTPPGNAVKCAGIKVRRGKALRSTATPEEGGVHKQIVCGITHPSLCNNISCTSCPCSAFCACRQVSSTETYYRGLAFYLDEHPELLCDLLGVLQSRLDHGRVVDMMRRANQLPLIKDYLLGVQVCI